MSDDRDDDADFDELNPHDGLDPLGDLGDLSPFADGNPSTGSEESEGTNITDDSDYELDDSEYADAAAAVYAELLARTGEAAPQPRLEATRRVVELLGDPHRAYPIIHITGTNGPNA